MQEVPLSLLPPISLPLSFQLIFLLCPFPPQELESIKVLLERLCGELVMCQVDPNVELTKQQLAEDTLLTPSNKVVRVDMIVEYQSVPFVSPSPLFHRLTGILWIRRELPPSKAREKSCDQLQQAPRCDIIGKPWGGASKEKKREK